MQFRERAKVIQVIRTVYDPAIKRGRTELVGRMDRAQPKVTPQLMRGCSPAELDEVVRYLAVREEALSRESLRAAAANAPAILRSAESYFRMGGDVHAGAMAADIFEAWDDLKKAMHKAGFRKPRDR